MAIEIRDRRDIWVENCHDTSCNAKKLNVNNKDRIFYV